MKAKAPPSRVATHSKASPLQVVAEAGPRPFGSPRVGAVPNHQTWFRGPMGRGKGWKLPEEGTSARGRGGWPGPGRRCGLVEVAT